MECQKVRFTKRQAEESLNYLGRVKKQYRKEKRYYYCDNCNSWHLTSIEDPERPEAQEVKLTFKDKWKQLLKNKNSIMLLSIQPLHMNWVYILIVIMLFSFVWLAIELKNAPDEEEYLGLIKPKEQPKVVMFSSLDEAV